MSEVEQVQEMCECPECGRQLPADGLGNGYCERRKDHPSGQRAKFVPATQPLATPQVCPTCGSNDPGTCQANGHSHPTWKTKASSTEGGLSLDARRRCCPDPFHLPTPGRAGSEGQNRGYEQISDINWEGGVDVPLAELRGMTGSLSNAIFERDWDKAVAVRQRLDRLDPDFVRRHSR